MASVRITQIIKDNPLLVREALVTSTSITDASKKLNINVHNTTARKILANWAKDNQISLQPKAVRSFPPKIINKLSPEESKQQVINNFFIHNLPGKPAQTNQYLKSLILRHELLPYECQMSGCNTTSEWNNKLLNLHLDHINGDNQNCELSNLRFLCPNCHSQTDTYTARNSNAYKNVEAKACLRCNELSKSGDYCRACQPYVISNIESIRIPTTSELAKEVSLTNINYVTQKYKLDRGTLLKVIADVEKYPEYPLRRRIEFPALEEVKLAIQTDNIKTISELAKLFEIEPDNFYKFAKTHGIKELIYPDKKSKVVSFQPRLQKASYPPVEELLERINSDGYEVVSRELGVSGNAIRKHLKVRTGSYPKTRARLRKVV